jgi:hypothetical protein
MGPTEKYLGPIKVISVNLTGRQTPSGKEIVEVVLENQPTVTYTKDVFEEVATDTPIDFTLLRERTHQKTINDLTAILLERGIMYGDLKYVCQKLAEKVEDAYDRATNFLWTGRDKDWVPGVHNMNDRSILECEAILKKIAPEKSNDNETTTEKAE